MNESLEFSFERLLGFIRRGIIPALVLSIAVAAGVFLWTNRQAPSFYAEAVDYVSRSGLDTKAYNLPEIAVSPLNITAYRVAALSDPILGSALKSLNEPAAPANIEALRRRINLAGDEQPGLLYIGVTAGSPKAAADQANAIATELVAWDSQRAARDFDRIISVLTQNTAAIFANIKALQTDNSRDFKSEIAAQQALFVDQQGKLATAKLLRDNVSGGLGVLNPAFPPLTNVGPMPVFSTALAFLICMLLVFGLLFLRDMFSTRLYTVDEMAMSTGVAVVATLPRLGRRGRFPLDDTNALRETIQASTAGHVPGMGPRVIHVTSAVAGSASLSVAASLAESYARSGAKTLLVDTDMRTPQLGQRYRITGVRPLSLSDSLRNTVTERAANTIFVTDRHPMDVLFDRTRVDDPGDLLARGLAQKVTQWRSTYDYVVMHSGPLLVSGDGALVGADSDTTLLVARQKSARRRTLLAALGLLDRRGSRVLGIVATGTAAGEHATAFPPADRPASIEMRKVSV